MSRRLPRESAPQNPSAKERLLLTVANAEPTRQDIELAAYFRWRRNGGDPLSNWLAAEGEVMNGRNTGEGPAPVQWNGGHR